MEDKNGWMRPPASFCCTRALQQTPEHSDDLEIPPRSPPPTLAPPAMAALRLPCLPLLALALLGLAPVRPALATPPPDTLALVYPAAPVPLGQDVLLGFSDANSSIVPALVRSVAVSLTWPNGTSAPVLTFMDSLGEGLGDGALGVVFTPDQVGRCVVRDRNPCPRRPGLAAGAYHFAHHDHPLLTRTLSRQLHRLLERDLPALSLRLLLHPVPHAVVGPLRRLLRRARRGPAAHDHVRARACADGRRDVCEPARRRRQLREHRHACAPTAERECERQCGQPVAG